MCAIILFDACPGWNGPGRSFGLCWEFGVPEYCGSGIDPFDSSSGSTFRNVVASMGTMVAGSGFMNILSSLY